MADTKVLGAELKLDQEYVKAKIDEIVKAGIIQALGDPEMLVKKAIDLTINRRVDRDGKDTNSEWNSTSYLQYLAQKVVEKTVRETLEKYIEENREEFQKEILRQMSNKKFRANMASTFLQTILDSSKDKWRSSVHVQFVAPKEDRY